MSVGVHRGARGGRSSCSETRIQTIAITSLETLTLTEATFTRRRARLLDLVNLDLDRLRLRLAKDLSYLDRRRYEHAARRIDEVGPQVGGWRRAHRDAPG